MRAWQSTTHVEATTSQHPTALNKILECLYLFGMYVSLYGAMLNHAPTTSNDSNHLDLRNNSVLLCMPQSVKPNATPQHSK